MTALRQRMLDDLRIRNYAPSTVLCYIRAVAAFAKHFHKSPRATRPRRDPPVPALPAEPEES